jgi:hypothetical protein
MNAQIIRSLIRAFSRYLISMLPIMNHDYSGQDTVTGFLLAGVGHRTAEKSNFLVVKPGKR